MNGVSVIIPVHNEDPHGVVRLYCELSMMGAEIIIVDDGDTMELPDDLNTITYAGHVGYGYAIKQGIKAATNPLVITMDGDLQHTTSDAQKLYQVFNLIDDCAMVVGSRWNLNEKFPRWIGRKLLNFLASCISGHYLVDLNSGMRIFKRDLALSYSPILCDSFSFTTSLTMAMVSDKQKIAYFPINVKPRKHGKSHVKLFRHGFITLYYIFWIGLALRTRGIRAWLRNLRLT